MNCRICGTLSFLGFASGRRPIDPRLEFDPSDLPQPTPWCPSCLWRDIENGFIDPLFRRFFNRDPERRPPAGPGLVVAPADGVLNISERPDHWRLLVHIRLSDVHVQRVPIDGRVASVDRLGQVRYSPADPRYESGVQVVTTLDTEIGRCEIRQITSHLTPRIRNRLRPGQPVSRGQRLGRILLGSRTVLHLPKRARPVEKDGQRVVAGESIIAEY